MHTERVDSSVIDTVSYDDEKRILEVQFRSGRYYHYFNVPPPVFDAFLQATSLGKFFNDIIRPNFRSARIRESQKLRPHKK